MTDSLSPTAAVAAEPSFATQKISQIAKSDSIAARSTSATTDRGPGSTASSSTVPVGPTRAGSPVTPRPRIGTPSTYAVFSILCYLPGGWLADRVGSRQLFILALAGFIFASMLCGAAQNLEEMVAFRAIQGVAGGFIMPLSQAFMLDTSKPSRHPQMMALWGMGVVLGPILGPIIGGWLTETANWRWVFYVNVPAGLVTLAILIACLPHRPRIIRRFDIFGFLLLGFALTSLQLLLDRGHQVDWFAATEIWIYALIMLSSCCEE